MLGWFWDWLARRTAFTEGFNAGHDAGTAASRRSSERIIQDARDRAKYIERDVAAQIQGIKAAAEAEGKKAGRDEGYEEGLKKGEERGRRHAYEVAAVECGIYVPRQTEELPDEPNLVNFHINWGPHPNIYQYGRDHWVVRMILNGNRRIKTFQFKVDRTRADRRTHRPRWVYTIDKESCRNAMMQAIRWRDQRVVHQDAQQHIITELWNDVYGEYFDEMVVTPEGTDLRNLLVRFHDMMLSHEQALEYTAFLGDDPEDRLNISDKSILTKPWIALWDFDPPERYRSAFRYLGLGESSENARTVRDVLLLTAKDLTDVNNFGKKSVDVLRRKLGQYGLALWNESVAPELPPDTRRHHRSIEL